MNYIGSKSYKYLKKLCSLNDWVVKSDDNKFEIERLYRFELLDSDRSQTQRYRINEAGKRYFLNNRQNNIVRFIVLAILIANIVMWLVRLSRPY